MLSQYSYGLEETFDSKVVIKTYKTYHAKLYSSAFLPVGIYPVD